MNAIREWAETYLSSDSLPDDNDSRISERNEFWFRRFFTSITLGHAAAIIGLGAFLSSAENQSTAAAAISFPITVFGFGLGISGILPFSIWLRFVTRKAKQRTQSTDPEKPPQAMGYKNPIKLALLHIFIRNFPFLLGIIGVVLFVLGLMTVIIGIHAMSVA